MLTVACVNVGDYLGRGEEYVTKLASMAKRHLPAHQFVVITESEHRGWWCKLELFRPGMFTGPTVYFDLDVVIRADLTGLVALLERGDFWALDDFAWPLSKTREDIPAGAWPTIVKWCGGRGTCNSSVMLWNPPAGERIWTAYSPEAAAGLAGDQNWITKTMGQNLRLIPSGWAGSYKYGPARCPITIFHGLPKPHEVNDPNWH